MSDRPPRTATLEDVARVAVVSRATGSRVINGVRNVDLELQESVRKAIAATGYAPNRPRARWSPAGPARSCWSSPAHPAGRTAPPCSPTRSSAAGVVDFLRPLGIHPLLMLADTDEARADVLSHLRQGTADGALVVSTHAVLFARPATSLNALVDQGVQFAELEARLVDRYGADQTAVVHRAVAEERGRFAHARIHAFVPILVERSVRSRLDAGIREIGS